MLKFRYVFLIGAFFSNLGFSNLQAQEPIASKGPYRTEFMRSYCKLAINDKKNTRDRSVSEMSYMMEGVCFGVVSTTMRLGPQMSEQFRFCAPPSLTPEIVIPILLDFVDNNPRYLEYDIRDVVNYFGRVNWPCPPKVN